MSRLPALLSGLVTAALVVGGLTAIAAPASAEPGAGTPGSDSTVTADALPTVQIDGVVWAQVVVGNTVYVGGEFTTARPAGSAPGVNTVPRANLLAYDITTGNLIDSWAPTTNGPVYALNVSPDQKRIYVGGNFNRVNGSSRNRFAALDATTGQALTMFPDGLNGEVRAIASTSSTVYLGGSFNTVDGLARNKVAAYDAATGAVLPWTASPNRTVYAMAISPDKSQVYLGGTFESINGVDKKGTGALDATTAAISSWSAYPSVYDSGANAGITSLSTDGTLVYATAFTFLSTGLGVGNVEGAFATDPVNGSIVWVDDCHGDTYSVFANPGQDHVYVSGHPHMCNNIGAYPEVSPRRWFFATAYTKAAKSQVTPDTQGGSYKDNSAFAAPEQLNYYPDFTPGTYTVDKQATWSVSGNAQYVTWGGEFTAVNGVAQQGLVRMAKSALSTNKQGPMLSSSAMTPTVVAKARGSVDISWPTSWDRDEGTLTYTVLRNGQSVYSVNAYSRFWAMPRLSWVDTGLADSTSYSYAVVVSDSSGNAVTSPTVFARTTAGSAVALSPYAATILNENPNTYWRMNEPFGVVADWTGYSDLSVGSAVARNVAGALVNDPNTAASFPGTGTASRAYSAKREFGLNNLSVEAWFKTTSTAGGKIIGFGSSTGSGDSTSYDRHLYMTAAGKIVWGVYPGAVRTISSTLAYNDGTWHHVVGTVGPSGMQLYVDAVQVAANPAVVSGQFSATANGSWHVGGDNLTGWPDAAGSNFAGQIDDVATYGRQLTGAQIANHYTVGSGKAPNLAPTAAFSAAAGVLTATVDASTSVDTDGSIASYAWTWGDGTTTTTVSPTTAHAYPTAGTYTVSLVVTDNKGATATASRQLVVQPANIAPVALAGLRWTSGLAAAVTGAGSTDADGTIASYGWAWDDGTSTPASSSPTAMHTFATEGTHTATLTATDNQGGTSTSTVSFTLHAAWPDGLIVGDSFTRSIASGWGTADLGGSWTTSSGAAAVTGTVGTLTAAAGTAVAGSLTGASGTDLNTTASLSVDRRPSGDQVRGIVRNRIGANGDYRLKVAFKSDGYMSAWLARTNSSGVETTIKAAVTVPGGTYTAGTVVHTRLETVGTSATTVRAKVWTGSVEPAAWLLTVTDSTVGLQTAGTSGVAFQVPSTVTSGPAVLSVDDLLVVDDSKVNKLPTASFTAAGGTLSADVDASASADPDGSIVRYDWSWGDGATTTSTLPAGTHAFASAGVYQVALTVTDDRGGTASTTQSVTVLAPNVPPTASFTATGGVDQATVDASGSVDPDGSIVSYDWTWGDGSTSSSTTPTTSHPYAASGPYTITLTVTDDRGAQDTTTRDVVVLEPNVPPTASFTVSGADLTASVDGSASADPDGSLVSYAWTWGDGSTTTTTTPTTTHAYAAEGTYAVGLTVTDNGGATAVAAGQQLTVQLPANILPTASFVVTPNAATASADGSASADPDGSLVSYAWTWGDGSTTTTTTPTATHDYVVSGTYSVGLTVTDNRGGTATAVGTVTVLTPWAAGAVAGDHFERSVASGWGTADLGGDWTTTAGAATVANGVGVLTADVSSSANARLAGVLATASTTTANVSVDRRPNGNGARAQLRARITATGEYRLKLHFKADGTMAAWIVRTNSSGAETTIASSVTVPGGTYQPGAAMTMKLVVSGTSPTTLQAKVWPAGTAEPASWLLQATDATSYLQVAGAPGVGLQVMTSVTNGPVGLKVDEFLVTAP